jgi:hypothetical protein
MRGASTHTDPRSACASVCRHGVLGLGLSLYWVVFYAEGFVLVQAR